MAIARTGVFVDDYLEYSSSLHAEIQRHFSTMTELDIRANTMMQQNREDTKACLYLPTAQIHKPQSDEQHEFERLKKEIEANQENVLSLCTEKVLLAQQAYDLIDSHMKRLDEDLNQFADDLKQEGKISPDEPAILPIVSLHEKRKSTFFGPPAKRLDMRLDRDDRDTELMPPPASHKKRSLPTPDVDQPVDPNEPRYCICNQVSFGDMIACDNDNCTGGEWFHYQCVGLTPETRFKNKWYCPKCKELQKRGFSEAPA